MQERKEHIPQEEGVGVEMAPDAVFEPNAAVVREEVKEGRYTKEEERIVNQRPPEDSF